ncbi:long-chain fatty acid--CoA ligase [Pseudomonas sp. NFXW11]|uniref:AMP-dependent synthetase/ligase n=1 Tax=Pseudomonas sp. NFXW11 TaxID=2819531 RepID=UPI003CFBB130
MQRMRPPMDIPSIPALLHWRSHYTPQLSAARVRDHHGWRRLSWSELAQRSETLARALLAAGVEPGEPVAICSRTRLEWCLLDFAILSVGAVSVGLYPNLAPSQLVEQLRLVGCRLLFVEQAFQAPGQHLAPGVRTLCLDTPEAGSGLQSLNEFGALAGKHSAEQVRQRWQALDRQSLANLVFTSGTTGVPKAAMLSHGNLLAAISAYPLPQPGDTTLAFLPMAHVGERVIGHYQRLWCGGQCAYVAELDEVPRALLEVQPELLTSVPRLYEKLHAQVMAYRAQMADGPAALFDWAMAIGKRYLPGTANAHQARRLRLARLLVLLPLRRSLFGWRIHFLVSSGAPLEAHLVSFFATLGLPLWEAWGLSEATAFVTCNQAGALKAGSVGRPLPGVQLRIGIDNEVLVKGPQVFQGYFRQPDASAASFSGDGWLHTGDLGRLDDDGYLWLTGRKKELIITADGKNIAPVPIEARLRQHPLVEQVLVHGDRRQYLCALLALEPQRLWEWARRQGLGDARESWLHSAPLLEALQRHIDSVNQQLSQAEQIKRWALLPRLLSQEQGELTPTLKPRRRIIEQHFAQLLDSLYP